MKKIKTIIRGSLVVAIMLVGFTGVASAQSSTVGLTIRSGNTVIFSGSVPLQVAGNIDLNDSDGSPHAINSNSVLSVINDADLSNNSWSVSKLQYFSSFGSLYLKCLTSSVGENCDNWQYVVNGATPFTGMDQNVLSGGENVYVYFGPQNKITLSSNSITTNTTLSVTTQKYDYENDAWVTRTGVTVGVTQPNPSDLFNPTEILTSAVDSNGQATFPAISVGSYNVGVKEDYYFPTEPLSVTAPAPSGGGGSNGSSSNNKPKEGSVLGVQTKISFDLKKAFEFLVKQQKEDGTFGEDIYTDWVALSLSTSTNQEQTIKLIKHLVQSKSKGTLLTDYERRAMALMSLGLNPYNTNGENYIKKITDSFDGKQFGDLHQDNDDIFALIVLQNAGFKADEKMIQDDISFVLSAQRQDGSWDGSVDMTGAAIQALASFGQDEKARPNDLQVGQAKLALVKAKDFLKKSQKDAGGWGNASSTAWAMGGILALGEKVEDWKKDKTNNTPPDYLATLQDTDGGIKNENIQNKIWETAYVASALSGKTWNQIMQKFESQEGAGNVLGVSTEIKIETPKVAPKKTVKKTSVETPKQARIENSPIEVSSQETTPPPAEPEKKNWFMRFINFIF